MSHSYRNHHPGRAGFHDRSSTTAIAPRSSSIGARSEPSPAMPGLDGSIAGWSRLSANSPARMPSSRRDHRPGERHLRLRCPALGHPQGARPHRVLSVRSPDQDLRRTPPMELRAALRKLINPILVVPSSSATMSTAMVLCSSSMQPSSGWRVHLQAGRELHPLLLMGREAIESEPRLNHRIHRPDQRILGWYSD